MPFVERRDPGLNVPLRLWTDVVEEGALEQARRVACLPFVAHWVALMPDVHVGYGVPVGCAFAARDTVVPAAVGFDIACGMVAVRTNLPAEALAARLDRALGLIQRAVPTGFHGHSRPQDDPVFETMPDNAAVRELEETARLQLGSLGGGNHFLEVQRDPEGMVWLMLHSGSRNMGKRVCEHYNRVARKLNAEWGSQIPPKWDLAHLPASSPEGQEYLEAMHFCHRWAYANRNRMMREMIAAVEEAMAVAGKRGIEFVEVAHMNHNFAALEEHFGEQLWVHRKGAVQADAGEVLIVPGSMATASYICRGLGNPESFRTSAHGAGRCLSRSAARSAYSVRQVIEEMETRGVLLLAGKKAEVSEECGAAYKDVDQVIAAMSDLVTPLTRLTPIGVVKG